MRFSRSAALSRLAALTVAVLMASAANGILSPTARAEDKPVATVNGKPITEADLQLAATDLGPELAQLPEASRRRLLLEFLIESQIYSDAAEKGKLASGADYEARIGYWRRRALRDIYFEKNIKGAVSEAEAKKFYDEQVKALPVEDEFKASHILVKEEAQAKDIAGKLAKGGDFAALAKEFSLDPGSKDKGGDLDYFGKGQMVPEFEAAAFALEKGKISAPVKTNFGYHIIKLDDKRPRKPPPFEAVKDRITNSLIQKKAQTLGGELRTAAKVEYLDATIKSAVEKEKAGAAAAAAATPPKK